MGDLMDTNRLEQMADVTRRYARYRPCGAGLGVLWGGLLLALLGALVLQWTRHEYVARAAGSQTFWRFLRGTPLVPPVWLQLAALGSPVLAWLGLLTIQQGVDRRFGAVTAPAGSRSRPSPPTWFAPAVVAGMACVLASAIVWNAGTASARGAAAMLAIGAFALVWGRRGRDQLTLLVMFAVSVPSLYLLMATDPTGNLAANSLIIFATYCVLMASLVIQGVARYAAFLKVRAELDALQPVEE